MKNEVPRPDSESEDCPEPDSGSVKLPRSPRWREDAAAPDDDAGPSDSDSFRSAEDLATGFFLSVPSLETTVELADQSLSRLTRTSEEKFIGELVGKFASWVVDLPASGRYHHPQPFGLLEHSAEVAAVTLLDLEARWCHEGGGGVLSLEDRALWSRVAFALGLYHDCGKILDAEVQAPDGSGPWNPLAESLASFKIRQGLPFLGRTPCRLRRGRERYDHEKNGGALLPLLLAETEGERIRPQVEAAWTAFISRHLPLSKSLPIPLAFLADRVHQADCTSARLDRKRPRALDPARPPWGPQAPSEDP